MITVSETSLRLAQDYAALLRHYKKQPDIKTAISFALIPGWWAVCIHRTSHYFHKRGPRFVGRVFYLLNLFLTGADINPHCDIGGGLLILHPRGMIVFAKIGRNALLACHVILGVDGRWRDGEGAGFPILGDNVTCGARSTILGPYTIGDGAMICACTFIHANVKEGATMIGSPAREIGRKEL